MSGSLRGVISVSVANYVPHLRKKALLKKALGLCEPQRKNA